MTHKNVWAVAAALAVGFLSFGIALALLGARNSDTGTTETRSEARSSELSQPARAETEPAGDQPTAKNSEPKAVKPRRPLVLNRWKMPGEPENEGKGIIDEYSVREIHFDPTGSKLVLAAPRAVHCLEIETGKIVATVQPDLLKGKYVHYHAVLSPDGRFVAVPRESQKELDLRETATGRLIRTYRLEEHSRFSLHDGQIAFSPGGDSLLASVDHDSTGFHLISTQSGSGRALSIPGFARRKDSSVEFLYVPEQSTLLVHHLLGNNFKANPSGMGALDMTSGQETPLTSLGFRPHSWDHDRPLKVSPDGTLLLVKGENGMQVCDWRANRLVFEHSAYMFQDPAFTPDGKRVLAIYHDITRGSPGYIIFRSHVETSRIELFDLATKETMGTFTPQDNGFPHAPTALAVSPDGRTVAVATQRTIGLLDFQAAFGVPPLPVPPPTK